MATQTVRIHGKTGFIINENPWYAVEYIYGWGELNPYADISIL
jgi:hypothetical protein